MIREFKKTDSTEVKAWYSAHGRTEVDSFPQVGFIVPGVAVGFLMQTDTDIGIVEGFVSNPKARARDVYRATELIAKALFAMAIAYGFRRVVAFTQTRSIEKLALRQGYQPCGEFSLFDREIT